MQVVFGGLADTSGVSWCLEAGGFQPHHHRNLDQAKRLGEGLHNIWHLIYHDMGYYWFIVGHFVGRMNALQMV